MKRALLGLLALGILTGCETNVRFRNSLPNATLKDVRWVSDVTGEAYRGDGDPLRSGETSASITIHKPKDEDARGQLHFELVVDGKRVALVTKNKFRSRRGATRTFTVKPGTEVDNPVLEALQE